MADFCGKKKKMVVLVPEVYYSRYEVNASDEYEALKLVRELITEHHDQGEDDGYQYSLPSESWVVKEVNPS